MNFINPKMKVKRYSKTSWFKSIDIFGNLFNFTINKQTKFKTNLGSILSLITLFIIIIACIFFGTDFYNRKNPKVLSQKTVPENYSKIDLNNKILTFSWRIEDSNGFEIDFTGILFPVLIYSAMTLNPETKNLEFDKPARIIPYKRCNETINEPNFYKVKYSEEWYCFDFDVEKIEFGGNWDGSFVNYFMFQLNVCQHDENNYRIEGSCVSLEKLKEFLNQRIFLSINVPNVYFDFTDFENPLKIEYKNYFSHLTRNLLRVDFCYFNLPLMKDDRGWIFSDYQYETNISFDHCDRNFNIKTDDDYLDPKSDDILFGMDLYLDKSYPYYIRTYMKFQDLVAIVGGFIKLITLIFGFVNLYFNNYERDKFIINYFFDSYDNNGEDENKINSQKKGLFRILNQKSFSHSNNFTCSNDFLEIQNNVNFNLKDSNHIIKKRGFNTKRERKITKKRENIFATVKQEKNSIFKYKADKSEVDTRNPVFNNTLINDTMKLTINSKNHGNDNSFKVINERYNEFNIENNKIENTIINNSKLNNLYNKIDYYSDNISNRNSIKKISLDKLNEITVNNNDKESREKENKYINIGDADIHNTVVSNKNKHLGKDKPSMNLKFIKENKDRESIIDVTKSKKVYFLNETTDNNIKFQGFFKFYAFKFLSCFKNKRKYNLYKIENFLKEHINDKFDLLKYYKRYNHYKYLKKIILSTEQKTALKKLCNLKSNYKAIYKPSTNCFYEEEDRDLKKIASEIENDIIDERIKQLINLNFLKT